MQSSIKNRTIFCRDNLDILQGMDSNSIDLIYLDPPFNKKKVFTAPIGSSAEGASFKDIFREEDVKEEWLQTIKEDYDKIHYFLSGVISIEGKKSYNFCYLAYMAIRLIEMKRILKDTGSIYLHCDSTMSHYLKILLDCIFEEGNFRNEIAWCYDGPQSPSPKNFQTKKEYILRYSKSNNYYADTENLYKSNLLSEEGLKDYSNDKHGYYYTTPKGDYTDKSIEKLKKENRIHITRNGKVRVKHYLIKRGEDYYRKKKLSDVWADILNMSFVPKKEKTKYPTQKPIALLERIIKASSKEGGIVLDPFCGCATTCVAAEKLDRKWIGIDVSHKAYELVQERLSKEVRGHQEVRQRSGEILDTGAGLMDWNKKIHYSTSPPKRTDMGVDDQEKKYVYIISHENYPDEYKVGIAKHWQSRLNSYQTSDPDRKYKMEYKLLTHNYRKLEKHIHTVFPNKHEWVKADLPRIRHEIESYNQKAS